MESLPLLKCKAICLMLSLSYSRYAVYIRLPAVLVAMLALFSCSFLWLIAQFLVKVESSNPPSVLWRLILKNEHSITNFKSNSRALVFHLNYVFSVALHLWTLPHKAFHTLLTSPRWIVDLKMIIVIICTFLLFIMQLLKYKNASFDELGPNIVLRI